MSTPPPIHIPLPISQADPYNTANAAFQWHYTNASGQGTLIIPGIVGPANNLTDVLIVLSYVTVGSQEIPVYCFFMTAHGGAGQELVMVGSQFVGWNVINMMLENLNTGVPTHT